MIYDVTSATYHRFLWRFPDIDDMTPEELLAITWRAPGCTYLDTFLQVSEQLEGRSFPSWEEAESTLTMGMCFAAWRQYRRVHLGPIVFSKGPGWDTRAQWPLKS